MTAWTQRYLAWVKTAVRFAQPAQEATLLDYLHEVEHMGARLERLARAIDEAVTQAPAPMRAVIDALQALRGIALVSAVTIVAEVGQLSRFARAPQVMGYSGMGAREDSSGGRTRRGGITKTGNAHLRRILVEAAWAYRHRPSVGSALRKRQAAAERRGEGDRLESAASLARPLPAAPRPGHGESPTIYAAGLRARPALLVRGSSRRITFAVRPRYQRINRRCVAAATSGAAFS